jgi:ABC-type dipeptide/oligopeptide/nickel transport system permease subunit
MAVHIGLWWWLAWPLVIILATGSLYLIATKLPRQSEDRATRNGQ